MSTITIDATELNEAAPRIGALYATLAMSARQLRAIDVSCAMPPGLAGQVAAGVSDAAHDLSSAERTMDGMDADIRKRAQLAKIADAIGKVKFGLSAPQLTADLIDAARKADEAGRGAPYGVSEKAGSVAKSIKGVLGAVGTLGSIYDSATTYANPYLDDNRKGAELAAQGGTLAGTLLATGAAVGAAGVAVVSLPAVAIGAGIGVTYAVVDHKFHITDKLSDAVNSGLDAAGEGLEDAGEAVRNAPRNFDRVKSILGLG